MIGFLKSRRNHQIPHTLNGKFFVTAVISILATLAYFGMLCYALLMASYPPFADLFRQILGWDVVPVGIWTFWFGVSVSGARV
jgi:apolipoprotein N-acyltransferase